MLLTVPLSNAIAEHDAFDPTSSDLPVQNYLESLKTDLKELKIGV